MDHVLTGRIANSSAKHTVFQLNGMEKSVEHLNVEPCKTAFTCMVMITSGILLSTSAILAPANLVTWIEQGTTSPH